MRTFVDRLNKYFCTTGLVMLSVLLTACTASTNPELDHIHKWDAANCTRGELCWSCKETRGEALGHDWVDATCTVAKRCSRCGLTEGASLGGHVSNGSESCSRCGETLNVVAKINANSDLGYYDPRPLVYGGVMFEFPLASSDLLEKSGYPTDFVICDQSGAEVARGNWPKNPPYVFGKNEDGKWIWNRKTHTEFVSLEPGTYIVTFHFYSIVSSDTSPDVTEDSVCIPAGEFQTGHCTLIVK